VDFEDVELEPFPVDGMQVPLLRLTQETEPPDAQIKVGEKAYQYDRSYPIKGNSAVMPGYLREQLSAGKAPLLIERPTRYYVYLAV
jgi:hypothetical protein